MNKKLVEWKYLALSCAILLFAPGSIRATIVVPYTLAQRTQKAGVIVVARVESKHSAWDEEGREIHTYITLRVLEKIKGEVPGDRIVLRQLGGIVGNIESHVSGMPQFEPKEKVLVFLGRFRTAPYFGVIDWLEGKKTVRRDTTGREVVRVGMKGEKTVTIEEYIQNIRTLLRKRK